MSEAIITVENLSKRYKLGVIGATSLRESVERGWHRLRGRDWRAEMGTLDTRPWTRDSKGNGKTLDQGSETASQESPKSKVYSPMSSPNDLWALKDVSFEVKRGAVLGVIGRPVKDYFTGGRGRAPCSRS